MRCGVGGKVRRTEHGGVGSEERVAEVGECEGVGEEDTEGGGEGECDEGEEEAWWNDEGDTYDWEVWPSQSRPK